MKLKCCPPTLYCILFEDDFEDGIIGDDWVIKGGAWSIVADADPDRGNVLTENGTAGAVIYPIIPARDDDMVVGPGDASETVFGLAVKWTGIPRIIVNYDPTTIVTSWVDIHTGETTTYKFYQNGVLLGEKTRTTTGWSNNWIGIRVAFGKRVDTDHLLTFSIWPTDPDGAAYCQTEGFYVCAHYAFNQRYCALGNGGSDPVYYDEWSHGDYNLPEVLCAPCDCNCEWHCVPWNLTATFTKMGDGNPDCDEHEGLAVSLSQRGEDGTGYFEPEDCNCWWYHDDTQTFCEDYDLNIALSRAINNSVDGAELTDFELHALINPPVIGPEEVPMIVEESTCKPLKLVFGPLDLHHPEHEWVDCCEWKITITKAA